MTMGDPQVELEAPTHSVVVNFSRANGRQCAVASVEVRCSDIHLARREVVDLLRSLAADIEVGAA